MFLFSSFRETSTNLTYDKVPTNVLPDSEDLAALREMEVQRLKWSSFLASCRVKNIWEEDWLWHNRVNPPLASGPIQKKFMLLFSQKVKTRQQVKGLIRSGVPPELRGHVWYACSGAEGKRRQARPEESYSHLVNLVSTLEGSQIAVDIEKDLLRTFPERINEEHGITSDVLRRVLLAYALRNPNVGYCQSMNYLCALLLLHMKEEHAFWTFAALIEDILPADYYTPTMIGGRIDQHVFQSCIAWKLPKLYEKFKSTATLLEPIICPWFLCLFINVLPLYTVCRVWDCLFWEGNAVLFRIGLTMIRSKMNHLLEANDFIQVYNILKANNMQHYSFELEVPPCQQIQGQHGGGSSGNGHHHHHQTNKEKSSDEDLSGGDGSNSGLSPEDLTANTNNHNNSNNNGNNHNSGSGSMTEESAQISSSEFLIRSAFGYRWLRSVPVGKVELLREKFSQLFAQEEESNKRNALLGSPTSPKSNNNNNNNSNSNNSTNGVITVRHSSSSGSNGSFSPKGQQYTPTASPQPDHHKELNDNNNNNSNSNREITLDRARRRTVRTRKSELMLMFLEEKDMQYLHDLASQTLHEENFAEQVEEFARQLHADSTASSSSSSNGQQGGVKEDLLRKGLRATTTTPPSRSRTVEEEEENDDDDLEDDVIGDDEVVNAFKKS
eukprot:gene5090-5593_t